MKSWQFQIHYALAKKKNSLLRLPNKIEQGMQIKLS